MIVIHRRIARVKNGAGERAFLPCEVSGADAPVAVVAVNRPGAELPDGASVARALKTGVCVFPSRSSVPLLKVLDGERRVTVYLRKLHSMHREGRAVFVATEHAGELCCSPKSMGLDDASFSKIQHSVSRAAGFGTAPAASLS